MPTATWPTLADIAEADLIPAATINDWQNGLTYLLNRPSAEHTANEGSDYTIASSTWADVDATDYALTLDIESGAVLVGFNGTVNLTSAGAEGQTVHFDVAVDGTRQAGDDGIIACANQNTPMTHSISFVIRIDGLSEGSHTFKLQWKRTVSGSSVTVTLYAGAGTSQRDVHPQFWVQEV